LIRRGDSAALLAADEDGSIMENGRRLWIPALGCGSSSSMVDRTISMPENGSLALAA